MNKKNKINYHHGPMKLGFDDNILIHKNQRDILYLMKKKLK